MEISLEGDSGRMNRIGYDPRETPYLVRERDFPLDGSFADQLMFLLQYAILAPSTHNTQPWRFALTPEGNDVFADYGRRLPVVDPANRELYMSVGAAVFNLRVAAGRFRMPCIVEYNTSGSSDRPLVAVRLARPQANSNGSEHDHLFQCIPIRHTNRGSFLLSRVPASVLQRLSDAGRTPRLEVLISSDGKFNEHIGCMVAEAERNQWEDERFRTNTEAWLWSENTVRDDGIPAGTFGWSSVSGDGDGKTPGLAEQVRERVARDRNLCIDAPGLLSI